MTAAVAQLKRLSARFLSVLERTLNQTPRNRRRHLQTASGSAAHVESLEARVLLSAGDQYPDLVPTVGEYDENAVQTNAVDAVAFGSSMTDAEFAARLATAYANNTGGVIDATGDAQVFGFGQNLGNVLHVVPADDTDWILGTPTDRNPISGSGAFATTYAASTGGANVLSQYFAVESFDSDLQVLEFGLTVLGQNYEDYGTVYLFGHLLYGGDLQIMHQVQPGETQDVFYGLTAPPADYFIGFTLAYAPDGAWIVDEPLWFDDFGFITGDYLAGGNQAPTASDDEFALNEDGFLTTYANYGWPGNGVLANDFDPESHDLTAVLVNGPQHGTLDWNFDGGFTYTPNPDFSGVDSFTYYAHDGFDPSNVATVTLNVAPSPDAPIAQNDAYTLDENTTLTIDPAGVLANDSDLDGDTLFAELVSGPVHGSLTLNPDGSFVYTPDANYHGSDSFSYRVQAGGEVSNTATVALTVLNVNDPPTAADDAYSVGEEESLSVPAGFFASLDMISEPGDYIGQGQTYDLDQTTGTFTASRNFDNGVGIHYNAGPGDWWTLQFAAPYAAPLTPGVYLGATRFPFQADDAPGLSVSGQGRGSNTLTGEFTVHEVVYGAGGEVLVFDASFEQHSEGADPALTGRVRYVARIDVLTNDTDPDGDPLSAVLVAGPSHGSLTLGPDGGFLYTSDPDFHGTDSFTYQASDGLAVSNPATVTITVLPVNDPPTAENQSLATNEDTNLNGNVSGQDVDGDALTFALAGGPSHGSLVFNADGSFSYTPNAEFHGSDSFTFVADDGSASSQTATVTITVHPVNDAPTLSSQTFSLAENSSAGTTVGSVIGADVDGDALTYAIVAGNAAGAFSIDPATGVLQVADSAPLDFETMPQFTLTVQASDAGGLVETASVIVTLTDIDETLVVTIDIKPGDSSNSISSKGHGRTEVAILSSANFDALNLDIESLRFGHTGSETSLYYKNGVPQYRYEDVNDDGLLDVIAIFERHLMNFIAGDTTGYLTGQLLDGTDIAGDDDVNLTGNW